jgi:GR25 family glycosyltransferase involved in LPS biosynthesis
MKAYVINIPRRVDRLTHAKREASRLDIPLIVWEAVDGHEAYHNLPSKRLRGHAGCRASHRRLLKTIAATSTDKYALILEDDVLFMGDINKALTNIPEGAHLVYFGANLKRAKTWLSDHPDYLHVRNALATHCYVVKVSEAETIARFMNQEKPVDHCLIDYVKHNEDKCYLSREMYAAQAALKSDITGVVPDQTHNYY